MNKDKVIEKIGNKMKCIHCGKKIPSEGEICSACFVSRTKGKL